MMRWLALLVTLGLSACGGVGGLGSADVAPSVQLADLRFAQAGLLEQSIGLDLRFTNPNPVPIRADGMRFALSLGGNAFGTGVSDADFEIPRLGEAVVPVTIRVQTGELINRLLTFDGGNIDYRISGDLFQSTGLGGASKALPFDGQSTITIPDIQGLVGRLQGN